LSVEALLITHEEVTVSCTFKVAVAVAASDAAADNRESSAAAAILSMDRRTIGWNAADMIPRGLRPDGRWCPASRIAPGAAASDQ